jgi:hypothetical protein
MTGHAAEVPYRRIGTILVEWRLITQRQLTQALDEQERTGRLLGEILVSGYGVSRVDLADALAEQWQEANRAATAAADRPEDDGAAPAPADDDDDDPLGEGDLRVLLEEAEAARTELTLRTEELSRRLATLETLVVGVTQALDELRRSTAAEVAQPVPLPTARRARVRAGAQPPAHGRRTGTG